MRTSHLVTIAGLAAAAMLAAAPSAATARERIVIYEDVNYGGSSRVINGDIPNLNDVRFNDIVSSARVEDGTWELCEHANYRGRCITLRRDKANFVPDGFNDTVSSIRLVSDRGDRDWDRGGRDRDGDRDWGRDRDDDRGGRGDGGYGDRGRWDTGWDRWVDHPRDWRDRPDITVYEDVNYRGDHRRLDGNVGNLQNIAFNDTVSSLRIRSGVWQVCEHASYGGRCMTFDRDVPSLVTYGFNDRISSIRRIR